MPAYTNRTAVRQGVEAVVFDAANPNAVRVLNGNFYQWMVSQSDGVTTGLTIMNQGLNKAEEFYTISAAVNGAAVTLINGSFDYSGTFMNSTLSAGRLTVEMTTDVDTLVLHDIPQSEFLPGTYYPGLGTSHSLDVSTFNGLSMDYAEGGIIPVVGASPSVFKMGRLWYSGSTSPTNINEFYLSLLGSEQGLYKAFETPGVAFANAPDAMVTWNDGVLNYTYCALWDGAPNHFLTEWTKAAYPAGAFDYDNFNITLSDPVDNAFFQDYFYGGGASWFAASNGDNFIITRNITFPLTTAMAFVFNSDMTEYTRYDIDFDGSMEDGMFFIDELGGQWLNGYTADGGALSVYIDGTAPALEWSAQPTTVQNPDINRLRAWPFTLDGHEHWVLRLGENATLVYDLTTQQWAEWTNEDWDVWRVNVGLNWGSQDIVAGDLRDGQIWNIDPVARVDDVDYKITSIITGGLPVRGLDAVPCHVLLTAAVGEPSVATGCGVKLESSDDEGNTWTDHGTLDVTDGDYNQLKWLSIGQMEAPGRVFRFTDIGATTRIDGADTLDG